MIILKYLNSNLSELISEFQLMSKDSSRLDKDRISGTSVDYLARLFRTVGKMSVFDSFKVCFLGRVAHIPCGTGRMEYSVPRVAFFTNSRARQKCHF